MELVEKSTKESAITIKPYFIPDKENMGLEKYEMVVFPDVIQEEQMACIEENGVIRYLTGLNEFAPEVVHIKDPEKKTAVIKDIRQTVAILEGQLASNIIDPEDKEFWNKVVLLKPNNIEFWSKITIACSNKPLHLDPKDPFDLIKIKSIEAGGFSLVGKSLEDAENALQSPKFYLDRKLDTVKTKIESVKLQNKAISELEKLYTTNKNKLLYVAKVIDPDSAQYRKSTDVDILYQNLDIYLKGKSVEKNITKASQKFLDTINLKLNVLRLKALVKDAIWYRFIVTKHDGMIYDIESNSMMGRNISDVVEYLDNPLNQPILDSLLSKIENYWD